MSYPYLTDDEAKLDEIIRQAESFLEGQLATAIAADQRALTFAGLLVAGVAALIGSAASTGSDHAAVRMLVIISALLLVAAGSALWSARPTPWQLPGNEPMNWLNDIQVDHDPMLVCKAATAGLYQSMIDDNKAQVESAKWAMRASMIIAAVALASGIVCVGIRVF